MAKYLKGGLEDAVDADLEENDDDEEMEN